MTDKQRQFWLDNPLAASGPDSTFTDQSLADVENSRLGGQNQIAYERLLQGRVTNVELERLGVRRVNSRIADVRRYLRQKGKTVRSQAVELANGLYEYWIE